MEFIRAHQLDFMLIMIGVCGVLVVMTVMPRFMSRKRRSILVLLELSAMMLLVFDLIAYRYRGNISETGGFIVRISNGMVYFLTLLIPLVVTHFLRDLYRDEGGLSKPPRPLLICEVLFMIGTVLIIVSQFTGLYYTFDSQNNYQRAPGHVFSYIIPFLIVVIQEAVIIRYRSLLNRKLVRSLAISIALPTIASVIQFFVYGLSLINLTTVIVVIVFYIYTLNSLAREVGDSRLREIRFYKEAQEKEAALFGETVEALANAIDAKDKYTRGHSARVAELSARIAKEAGFSEEKCKQVYFAGLLHDVGKIGIRDDVINKTGKLTDEEFEHIKTHTVLGNQILSSIRQSPYLKTGAHYHHERYDGRGYPEGLTGENIPDIARVIAVADAYDAMTSMRSYRDALSDQKVRDEIVRGLGRQFDHEYAAILLRMIDSGQV